MVFFNLLFGKFTALLIKYLLGRSASTWPGHIALQSNNFFISDVVKRNPHLKIVLVAGTNGKTTTTKALHNILESQNLSVIRNEAGANLLNGFASLLVSNSTISGRLKTNVLLFEVDENSFPLVLSELLNAKGQLSIVLLNLFRDQLDRYGEINTTAEKWKKALERLPQETIVIANADDPQIAFITKPLENVSYFTVKNKVKLEKELSHAVDSTTCPDCRHELKYSKIAYSHIGNYSCTACGFSNPPAIDREIETDLKGLFNIYNLTAATIAAERIFNIEKNKSIKILNGFKPAFGRQEGLEYKGKKIKILLSKNPTGFNESLKVAIDNKYSSLLLVLNDRIPDGRDISWIWDVDFEMLNAKKLNIVVSGDRTYDLANRLLYAEVKSIKTEENLGVSINEALAKTPPGKTLAILPTYSAMLEVRRHLTGKSIL